MVDFALAKLEAEAAFSIYCRLELIYSLENYFLRSNGIAIVVSKDCNNATPSAASSFWLR